MDLLGEGASGVEIMAKLALLQEDAFYRAKIRESTSIIAVRFIFPVDSIYRTYLVLFMLDEDRRLKDVHVSQGIIATRQLAKDQEP
jgi:hypothetical protein